MYRTSCSLLIEPIERDQMHLTLPSDYCTTITTQMMLLWPWPSKTEQRQQQWQT